MHGQFTTNMAKVNWNGSWFTRIRRFQKEYKEKFYCPDSGKYIEIA